MPWLFRDSLHIIPLSLALVNTFFPILKVFSDIFFEIRRSTAAPGDAVSFFSIDKYNT